MQFNVIPRTHNQYWEVYFLSKFFKTSLVILSVGKNIGKTQTLTCFSNRARALMRGSRNFRQGGPGQSDKKKL